MGIDSKMSLSRKFVTSMGDGFFKSAMHDSPRDSRSHTPSHRTLHTMPANVLREAHVVEKIDSSIGHLSRIVDLHTPGMTTHGQKVY